MEIFKTSLAPKKALNSKDKMFFLVEECKNKDSLFQRKRVIKPRSELSDEVLLFSYYFCSDLICNMILMVRNSYVWGSNFYEIYFYNLCRVFLGCNIIFLIRKIDF